MSVTNNNNVVKTPQFARYFDISQDNATPDWEFAGTGHNNLSEALNPQNSTSQYWSEKSASNDLDSYQPQWTIDADMHINQKTIMFLYDIGFYRKTGDDTRFDLLLVDLFQPIDGKENTFKARKQRVSAAITNFQGDAGKTVKVTGSLDGVGDQEVGEFNQKTKTWTAAEEA